MSRRAAHGLCKFAHAMETRRICLLSPSMAVFSGTAQFFDLRRFAPIPSSRVSRKSRGDLFPGGLSPGRLFSAPSRIVPESWLGGFFACFTHVLPGSAAQVMPNAFMAAVIGSEKKMGSTRSTMSPETSRKLRLFSSGTNARRAPLSMPTCKGSASDFTDLMLP